MDESIDITPVSVYNTNMNYVLSVNEAAEKLNLDVVEFVHLAEEIGLYVTLRPGPYVGADLDFGGLPPTATRA